MNEFYLSLGSNLGDREHNLSKAINSLSSSSSLSNRKYIQIERVSSLYESLAISNMKQPKFLNIALKIISELDSLELLKIAKSNSKVVIILDSKVKNIYSRLKDQKNIFRQIII